MTGNGQLQRFVLTLLNLTAVLACLSTVVYLILHVTPSTNNELMIGMVSTTLGALIQNHGTSQGWWFAQSKGGSETIAATAATIAASQPPQGPPTP